MIQRIQTLYLLFASVITSVASYFLYETLILSLTNKMFEGKDFFAEGVIITLLVSALISFITIFLFKKRPLQIFLGKLNILINFLLLGVLGYLLLTLSGEISFSEKGIWVGVAVFGSLLFLFLANRAIKKDENLVKSVDRLR